MVRKLFVYVVEQKSEGADLLAYGLSHLARGQV